jgi:hypothetical protein
MRILFSAFAAMAMMATAALAAEAEGKVTAVDRDHMTITLDDGNSYKLPGEFDVDAIKEGMDVLLAYDEVGGVKLITDMELPQ